MIEVLQQYLPITNIVLAFCIVFHLACEFFHYIHSFFASIRDNNLLSELNERVKYLEGVHKSCEKINCDHDNG